DGLDLAYERIRGIGSDDRSPALSHRTRFRHCSGQFAVEAHHGERPKLLQKFSCRRLGTMLRQGGEPLELAAERLRNVLEHIFKLRQLRRVQPGNSPNRSKKRLGVDSTFNCQSPRQVVDEIAKREIAGDNVWRILPWKITCHYCFSRCRANVASSRIGRQS